MESARTTLREAAWQYAESGREAKLGLQLDAASLRYTATRLLFETTP